MSLPPLAILVLVSSRKTGIWVRGGDSGTFGALFGRSLAGITAPLQLEVPGSVFHGEVWNSLEIASIPGGFQT